MPSAGAHRAFSPFRYHYYIPMKKLPHEKLEENKQKLVDKKALLSREIAVAGAMARRARMKSRTRLAFLIGDVVVAWSESDQSAKKSAIDLIVAAIPPEKNELVLHLLKGFSPAPAAPVASEAPAAAGHEMPKPAADNDGTGLLPFGL